MSLSRGKKILVLAFLLVLAGAAWLFFSVQRDLKAEEEARLAKEQGRPIPTNKKNAPPPPQAPRADVPASKMLPNSYYASQTFNNCAPAALSMALAYYDIRVSQEALAKNVRGVYNLSGKNDDKSTPPPELAAEARKYGLATYLRADGDIEILKQLVANDLPVVVRTLLHSYEDFAHYRVVTGYDEAKKQIIQRDGYEGKDLRFSYDDFLKLWQPFNYAYLVLVPPEKQKVVEAILGEELDENLAWRNALKTAERELAADPRDRAAQFNLAVASYYTGDYARSVAEFERVQPYLGTHVLWYQLEPILAYFELGKYDKVLALADKIFKDGNLAYSELYLLRGRIYLKQGRTDLAKAEFEKAVLYDKNSKEAAEALASVK